MYASSHLCPVCGHKKTLLSEWKQQSLSPGQETVRHGLAGQTVGQGMAGQTVGQGMAGQTVGQGMAGQTVRQGMAGQTVRQGMAGQTVRPPMAAIDGSLGQRPAARAPRAGSCLRGASGGLFGGL